MKIKRNLQNHMLHFALIGAIAATAFLLAIAAQLRAPAPVDAAPPAQTSRTFTVPPGKYVSTGIQLKKGQKFTINASGTVKVPTAFADSSATEWGPGGFCHEPKSIGCFMFGLRINVGQGTSEFYARNGEFTASADGELVLYVGEHDYERPSNDSEMRNARMSGAFSVTVTLPGQPPPQVQPPSPPDNSAAIFDTGGGCGYQRAPYTDGIRCAAAAINPPPNAVTRYQWQLDGIKLSETSSVLQMADSQIAPGAHTITVTAVDTESGKTARAISFQFSKGQSNSPASPPDTTTSNSTTTNPPPTTSNSSTANPIDTALRGVAPLVTGRSDPLPVDAQNALTGGIVTAVLLGLGGLANGLLAGANAAQTLPTNLGGSSKPTTLPGDEGVGVTESGIQTVTVSSSDPIGEKRPANLPGEPSGDKKPTTQTQDSSSSDPMTEDERKQELEDMRERQRKNEEYAERQRTGDRRIGRVSSIMEGLGNVIILTADVSIDLLSNLTGALGKGIKTGYTIGKDLGKGVGQGIAEGGNYGRNIGKGLAEGVVDVGLNLLGDKIKGWGGGKIPLFNSIGSHSGDPLHPDRLLKPTSSTFWGMGRGTVESVSNATIGPGIGAEIVKHRVREALLDTVEGKGQDLIKDRIKNQLGFGDK